MSDFPEPTSFNGAPGPEHDPGRSDGTPTRYRCCSCGWRGRGSIARAQHFDRTQHPLIVPKADPRYDPPARTEVA